MNKHATISYHLGQAENVICLSGELRLFSSAGLEKAFKLTKENVDTKELKIDLTRVELMDSTVLGILAANLQQHMQEHNKPDTIIYNKEDILKQLKVLGLDQLCLLEKGPNAYHYEMDEFIVIEEKELSKEELRDKVHQAHEVLSHLTKNSDIQTVAKSTENSIGKK